MPTLRYTYNASAPPPGNGQLRLDGSSWATVTTAYVSHMTDDGLNASALLDAVVADHRLYAQDRNDPTQWAQWRVTAPAVVQTGYVELAVELLDSGDFISATQQVVLVLTEPSEGLPPGGDTGAVLVKASPADFDAAWSTDTPVPAPPLPPLCTIEDVAALLGSMPSDPDQVALLIEASSAAVRAACGWCISQQLGVDLVVDGSGAKCVPLPTLYLTAVHALTIDGADVTVPAFLRSGVLLCGAAVGADVVARVDHGYNPTPPDVAMTTAGMVARSVASPVGVVGERLGAWSVNYDASPFAPNASRSATRVAPSDLVTLAPYMLPKVP